MPGGTAASIELRTDEQQTGAGEQPNNAVATDASYGRKRTYCCGIFAPAPYEEAMTPKAFCVLMTFLISTSLGFWAIAMMNILGESMVADSEIFWQALSLAFLYTAMWVTERVACLQPRWPPEALERFKEPSFYSNSVGWYMIGFLMQMGVFVVLFAQKTLFDAIADPPIDTYPWPRFCVILMLVIWDNICFYWVHFSMHKTDCLFRIHQAHHTPKMFSFLLGNWEHPFFKVILAFPTYAVPMAMFKLRLMDLLWTMSFLFFTGAFVHCNVRTPWILGFFIARPEQHVIHHEEPWPRPAVSKWTGKPWNRVMFCNLPLVEYVFGTCINPKVDPREDPDFVIGMGGNIDALNNDWYAQLSLFQSLRERRMKELPPSSFEAEVVVAVPHQETAEGGSVGPDVPRGTASLSDTGAMGDMSLTRIHEADASREPFAQGKQVSAPPPTPLTTADEEMG